MGAVGRPHGVKGGITLAWHGDYIPAAGDVILLKQGSVLRPYGVLACRLQKKLVLSLEGINDRSTAEALNGAEVFMDRDALPKLDEDACYLADLIGSRVHLPDGTVIGRLDHYEFPAGQPVWSIKDAQGREILFPAMPCFIKSLNPRSKEAVIDPPPGLLDIYQSAHA